MDWADTSRYTRDAILILEPDSRDAAAAISPKLLKRLSRFEFGISHALMSAVDMLGKTPRRRWCASHRLAPACSTMPLFSLPFEISDRRFQVLLILPLLFSQ